jgi:hypothetical protein
MLKRTPEEEEQFAKELVERLPEQIRIGAFDFRIVKWSSSQAAGADCYGQCSTAEQTIRVQRDMPSRYKAVDTTIHELTHAIYWAFDIEKGDNEERTVERMSSGLMAVYRDNPWLLSWIQSAHL